MSEPTTDELTALPACRLEALKKFASYIMDGVFEGFGLDSGEIQDEAEKLGIIETFVVTQKYLDEDNGGDWDWAAGDTAYRLAPWMQAAHKTPHADPPELLIDPGAICRLRGWHDVMETATGRRCFQCRQIVTGLMDGLGHEEDNE